jgi:hypothetical protein
MRDVDARGGITIQEPFNPHPSNDPAAQLETTYVALAKLARITSCFPAAFEPVYVETVAAGDATPDAKLQAVGATWLSRLFSRRGRA